MYVELRSDYKETKEDIEWSIEASATVKLISHDKTVHPIEKSIPKHKYHKGMQIEKIHFVTWNHIISNPDTLLRQNKFSLSITLTSSPISKQINTPGFHDVKRFD